MCLTKYRAKMLVTMDEREEIPPPLKKFWKEICGIDPVEDAKKYLKAHRRLILSGVSGGLVLVAGLFLGVCGIYFTGDSLYALGGFTMMILGTVVFLVGVGCMFSVEGNERFCRFYGLLLNLPLWLGTRPLPHFENKLLELAYDALVSKAFDILKFEKGTEECEHEDSCREGQLYCMRTDFKAMYDGMNELGLVHGPWNRFFRAAKTKLEVETPDS